MLVVYLAKDKKNKAQSPHHLPLIIYRFNVNSDYVIKTASSRLVHSVFSPQPLELKQQRPRNLLELFGKSGVYT